MAKPEIRIRGFEGEWETHKIGDLTSIVTGATPSTAMASYWDNGTIRWMSSGELNDKYIYDVKGRITDEGYHNSGTHLIPPNCVLIGLAGQGKTRGTAAINYVKLCTNQSIAALLPNLKLFNPLYLFHYIDNKYLELRNLSTGDGGRGGLNKQILLDFEVKLTSLEEQQAIAEFFKSLDSLIQTTTKKIASLKQLKSASLVSMFPQKGETKPRVRFKGFGGEWKRKCFGDLYYQNIVKNDMTYGTDKIISVANMYFSRNSIISDDNYLKTYNLFRLGDIAFEGNKSKNFAHGRFVENTIGEGIVSHVFEVFTPKSDKFDLYYWKYAINNERIMGSILVRCTKASTMMTNLVAKDFLKECTLVPSFEEQKQIGSFFRNLDNQISIQEQRLEKLKQIKSACLDKMFV